MTQDQDPAATDENRGEDVSKVGRTLWRTVGTLSGASFVAAGVAFVSNILAARVLGPELRGEVAFVLQLSYFLGPVLIIGSDRALLRASRSDRRQEFFLAGRRTLLVTSVVATVLAFLVLRDWRVLCVPMGVTIGWFLMRRAEVVSEGGYQRYLLPFLSFQALILVSHSALAVMGVTAWQAWAAAYAVPALALLPVRAAASGNGSSAPTQNLPLAVAALTQMWSLRGERILLPLMAGPAQLGLYVVVATATEPLYWVAQATADHSVRQFRVLSLIDRLRHLVLLIARFVVPAAALGLALWWLLVPVFGTSFAPARQLILPLVLASVVLACYRQVSAWVLAGQHPGRLGLLEGVVAGAATLLYPVGIALEGAHGAAWATVGVYAIAVLCGQHDYFHSGSPSERKT